MILEEMFGPDNAVNRLRGSVAYCTSRVGLLRRLWLTFVALRHALTTCWQSANHATLYKWCTVASGTFKYVVPRLTCHHEGAARVMTFQPRDNIFECSTSRRASSVLSYDQLWASTKSWWMIYLRFIYQNYWKLSTTKVNINNVDCYFIYIVDSAKSATCDYDQCHVIEFRPISGAARSWSYDNIICGSYTQHSAECCVCIQWNNVYSLHWTCNCHVLRSTLTRSSFL